MERDRKQSVQAGAARLLPRLLAMLEQVCRPDSGTGCEEGNCQVIDALRPLFEELGAQVEEIYEPGLGTHVVARLYPEGKPEGRMLLMGHLDTVFPLGSAEKHPFHIDGDWAWGLGAGDCKSGVLIALFAGLLLKQEGLLPPWELTYLLNCDEEIGSPSGQKLFAREARGADCALVFEGGREADGKIRLVTARRGVILGDIQVTGREAHAGKAYLEGRSAVLELAHQIIRLYGFNDPERGIYYNVAPISGGRPNGVVAGEAAGQFCVAGLPTNEDFAGVEAKLRSMEKQVTVDGCTVQVTWHTLFPAMERSAGSARLYRCAAAAAQTLGLEPEEASDPSATDGTWISTLGVPALDALGAMAEGIHTMEEHVSVSSIGERLALAALTIVEVCRGFRP